MKITCYACKKNKFEVIENNSSMLYCDMCIAIRNRDPELFDFIIDFVLSAINEKMSDHEESYIHEYNSY